MNYCKFKIFYADACLVNMLQKFDFPMLAYMFHIEIRDSHCVLFKIEGFSLLFNYSFNYSNSMYAASTHICKVRRSHNFKFKFEIDYIIEK